MVSPGVGLGLPRDLNHTGGTMDPTDTPVITEKRTPEQDKAARELVKPGELSFTPTAFATLMKKMSGTASSDTDPSNFRCRKLEIVIPLEACRLETYDEAFKLTLRELDSAAEVRAYRNMGGKAEEGGVGAINQASAPMLMALAFGKEAIYAHNGYVLQDHEKDFLWETLNMAGRLAVGNTFLESGVGIDDETMGKISASAVVS